MTPRIHLPFVRLECIFVLALIIAACGSDRTFAQDTVGELERAQRDYQAGLAKAHGAYVAALKGLVEKRTKAGDLEGALAVRRELQQTEASGPFKLFEPLKDKLPLKRSLVGTWRVSYGNNTAHVRTIARDGIVNGGGASLVVRGDDLVIQCDDGVIERITPAGERILVEHFNPGTDYPNKPPNQIGIGVRFAK